MGKIYETRCFEKTKFRFRDSKAFDNEDGASHSGSGWGLGSSGPMQGYSGQFTVLGEQDEPQSSPWVWVLMIRSIGGRGENS